MILEFLRDNISPCKYHDITKYHSMHNNEASFHYMYNHHTVTVGQYQDTLCHAILSILHAHIASVYHGNKICDWI